MMSEINRLFFQSRKHQQKKTLFFILENRTKETLHRIITNNVLNGTTIFTDEWPGYNGLDQLGYVHKTICHQRRFSRFEFRGNVATRVTTNHIERMWVELRKSLKFLSKKDFIRYLGLETYRQMFLFDADHDNNMWRLLKDFAIYGRAFYKNWFEVDDN